MPGRSLASTEIANVCVGMPTVKIAHNGPSLALPDRELVDRPEPHARGRRLGQAQTLRLVGREPDVDRAVKGIAREAQTELKDDAPIEELVGRAVDAGRCDLQSTRIVAEAAVA